MKIQNVTIEHEITIFGDRCQEIDTANKLVLKCPYLVFSGAYPNRPFCQIFGDLPGEVLADRHQDCLRLAKKAA